MSEEPLDSVAVDWHGLSGDRRWAFLRSDRPDSGFPWMTIRQRADMWRYRPEFLDPACPDDSAVTVTTPSGDVLRVTDERLADELGAGLRAVKQDRGVFDTMPLSVISLQTIRSLGQVLDEDVDVMRFRPNLLIDAQGSGGYPEDEWIGANISAGGAVARLDQRDKRCAVVNVDPPSGLRDKRILKAIAQERGACLGVYGTVVRPGTVSVGDDVFLDK